MLMMLMMMMMMMMLMLMLIVTCKSHASDWRGCATFRDKSTTWTLDWEMNWCLVDCLVRRRRVYCIFCTLANWVSNARQRNDSALWCRWQRQRYVCKQQHAAAQIQSLLEPAMSSAAPVARCEDCEELHDTCNNTNCTFPPDRDIWGDKQPHLCAADINAFRVIGHFVLSRVLNSAQSRATPCDHDHWNIYIHYTHHPHWPQAHEPTHSHLSPASRYLLTSWLNHWQ